MSGRNVRVEQVGPDRVALTGTRGSPPPDTLKVALSCRWAGSAAHAPATGAATPTSGSGPATSAPTRWLTTVRLRELLPEAAELDIHRYELPNIRALNFVIVGLIAPGAAATARPDAQANGLGEYPRSRYVLAPRELVPGRLLVRISDRDGQNAVMHGAVP
jgi:hypothetical protein